MYPPFYYSGTTPAIHDLKKFRRPEQIHESVDKLVDDGVYANRTEAFRNAARLLLRSQVGMLPGKRPEVSKEEIWEAVGHSFLMGYTSTIKGLLRQTLSIRWGQVTHLLHVSLLNISIALQLKMLCLELPNQRQKRVVITGHLGME